MLFLDTETSRIIRDHETHMKDMLKGGLGWFCSDKRIEGPFVAKLEGRLVQFNGAPYYTYTIMCYRDLVERCARGYAWV